MNKPLTLGSLFDGSGGFPFGGILHGITPVWASEVEPFPIRVTTKRFPLMRHIGDINHINGSEIPPVDIVTGGFPCQNLSLAGKRDGLHGERSGLFFQMVRVIKEMRAATENACPGFAVLENVPGLYSSNKGFDFLEVLNELAKIKSETLSVPMPESGKWLGAGEIVADGFSIAYRTFDSQFWGVAQRRRRCYIVVHFTGECAGKVLFDESRLSGHPSPCRLPWQGSAGNPSAGVGVPSGGLPVTGFEPGAVSRLGGHVWDGGPVGALRADMGDNQTAVVFPINTQVGLHHDKPGDGTGLGIGEAGEPAYTLQAAHPHAVAVENYPADSRVKLDESGTIQTLTERMGTGGGSVPLVMDELETTTLRIRSGCAGGGKGPLLQSDISTTLGCANDQTVFIPKVYGISSYTSFAMKSPNPTSGIYEAETSRTLDGNGGRPDCNQGGVAVVAVQGSMIGRKPENGPQGNGFNENVSYTLTETDRHSVAYTITAGCYTQVCEESAPTLQARDYKDAPAVARHMEQMTFGNNGFGSWDENPATLKASGGDFPGGENIVVENKYVVRRLMPQECAVLQGFPSTYCTGLETPEPTEEDIAFWSEVWETHRKMMGKSSKPKSRNQLIKWLKSPYSDAAEYKLWGNGVTLNVVAFILGGIAWVENLNPPDLTASSV